MEKAEVEIKKKVNVKDELENINSKTIFEFKKTMDNFEIEKVKIYFTKDEEKTVTFLFYDNDFFAVDRVNYKDGYEYEENKYICLSENLNYRIKKIPNVAKTRKILNIEDIETRIYDISEYIVLLKKEEIQILKVTGQANINPMEFEEYNFDKEKINENIEIYEKTEELQEQEEKSIKNKFRKLAERVKVMMIEPIRLIRVKLGKTNEIKMLSDGKHSIFEKED